MKMYHFNPHFYGEEYFVMAENKVKALEYLIKYLGETASVWINVNPLDPKSFPNRYTLDEYGVGEVVYTELC
jgi:hypothetical protein